MKATLSLLCFLCLVFAVLSAKKFDTKSLKDYEKTPGGYVHKTCVHHVGHNAEVVHGDDLTITVYRSDKTVHRILPCPYPRLPSNVDGNGWQVFAVYDAGKTLGSYNGTWNVPTAPSVYNDQLLYTFTGLQNDFSLVNGVDIIQPVLQFGAGPAGGGAYWGIASWYVASTNVALHSTLVEVEAGDSIRGTMVKPTPDSDQWTIIALDTTSNSNSTLVVHQKLGEFEPYAFVTLEVYDVTACTQYPKDPLNYGELAIDLCTGKSECTPANPDWQVQSQEKICNEDAVVNSPDSVTIDW